MVRTIASACLLAALPAAAAAQDAASRDAAGRGALSLTYENDAFGFSDRNYTSGVRAGWVTGERTPFAHEGALAALVAGDGPVRLRRSYALGHTIFTPRNTRASVFLPDQHPYAGYAYGEYGLLIERAGRLDRVAVQLGVVGPSAGGEWIQNAVHDIVGEARVLGWDNQIGDEVIASASYETQWRALGAGDVALGFDLSPHVGARVGNFQTYASAGAVVRLGSHLSSAHGPPRVEPGLPGAGLFAPTDGFAWHVFGGVQGRAVAHDITLDGSFLDDGDPSVDKEAFVGDVQLGFTVQRGGVQAAYTHVLRSKTFERQSQAQDFGSLTVGLRF